MLVNTHMVAGIARPRGSNEAGSSLSLRATRLSADVLLPYDGWGRLDSTSDQRTMSSLGAHTLGW